MPPASPLLRYATLLRREGRTLATPGLARRYIATVALPFKLAGASFRFGPETGHIALLCSALAPGGALFGFCRSTVFHNSVISDRLKYLYRVSGT